MATTDDTTEQRRPSLSPPPPPKQRQHQEPPQGDAVAEARAKLEDAQDAISDALDLLEQ
jgi:hypothetical protein